jgi:hypothetical protein
MAPRHFLPRGSVQRGNAIATRRCPRLTVPAPAATPDMPLSQWQRPHSYRGATGPRGGTSRSSLIDWP